MRLIAFGGDEDARGAAGRRARGLETLHIEDAADVPDEMPPAQAVMLPWPRSFREERLISAKGGLERERVLALIPACRAVLAGGDMKEEELAQTALVVRPEKDETFLRKNARLTAEGALATVMRVKKRALMRETALVTGYGRIGREMTARLCALGMFVIVCARSEEQMRMAHAAGRIRAAGADRGRMQTGGCDYQHDSGACARRRGAGGDGARYADHRAGQRALQAGNAEGGQAGAAGLRGERPAGAVCAAGRGGSAV
ncbi:MAG: hypothetical protein ACLUI3_01975 [Christensenellales bacterium]